MPPKIARHPALKKTLSTRNTPKDGLKNPKYP